MTRNWLAVSLVCLLGAVDLVLAQGTRTDARAVTGTVTILQEDDFETGQSGRIYELEGGPNRLVYKLRFPNVPDGRLRTGDQVLVHGRVYKQQISVSSGPDGIEILRQASAAATGPRSSIVLVADFQDSTVGCSDGAIADLMFDAEQSVDGLYRESSFGQLSLPGDTDNDGQPDVFRVSIDASRHDACDPTAWAAAADQAAQAQAINLGAYQHRIYVLPDDTTCTWAGLATLGCFGACRAWVSTCGLPDVYAHEIGHNLGLGHAATDTNNDGVVDCEYCDMSDFMGIGGVGWRQTNGPHKEQLGWFPTGQSVVASAEGDQTHVLSPLEQDPAAAGYPQLLKVARPGGPAGHDYYLLSYRQRTGYDGTLRSDYAAKINIHSHPGGASNTLFIDALSDGQTFHDEEAGVTITHVAHDDSSATVLVSSASDGDVDPPQDLRVATSHSTVRLSWQMQAADAPIYRVFRDGALHEEVDRSQYIDRGVTRGRVYVYHVVAVGAQGQVSEPSETIEVELRLRTPMRSGRGGMR